VKKITINDITAVILAGGKSSRLSGEDKGLMDFRGQEMINHVLVIVKPKVSEVLISANRNIDLYENFGKVIADDLENFQGPLAGISKALKVCSTPYLLILPCDSPFVDDELIDDLISRMEETEVDICVAHDGSIMHATFAIINVNLSSNLEEFLLNGGRKMAIWYRQHNIERIDVSDRLQVLTNLNKPEDFSL